jgi:aspartate aminotransferase-like enzyme
MGPAVTPAQLAEKLAEKHYAAVTVTHVETSTGVCAPVAELAKVVSQYPDTLMILDGVCATGRSGGHGQNGP